MVKVKVPLYFVLNFFEEPTKYLGLRIIVWREEQGYPLKWVIVWREDKAIH